MNTAANQQATGLQVFYNEETNVSIRTKVINGEPWFVGKDVCMMLGIQNSRDTLSKVLDEDEAGVATIYTRSSNGVEQNREVGIINESGLYHLIFISRKPEARAIRKWVTGTVLPSIRKTGSYSINNPVYETRQRLPMPKHRPYFAEWKDKVKNYISDKELKMVAATRRVTLKHVKRVYAGGTMSSPVATAIQKEAIRNRKEGKFYPDPISKYEQLTIEWENLE